jgi:pimeloyl-ACP methyl ester carboxylesterase
MRKVISKDGTAIAFGRSGEGQPIILVDGAFCSRAFGPMGPLAGLLAPHFTVFTYDRRGRNDSSDTAPYAVEREIEDLDALIKEAGGSAFVFGLSSGGGLALKAAASGLSIKKLALYEPPFVAVDDSDPRPPEDAATQLTKLTSSGHRGDAVEFFMTKVIGTPIEAVTPMRQAPIWPALEAVAHTLAYDVTLMGDYSLPTERVASVTIPTLVIDGENSPAPLRRAVQAVSDALPNAQRSTLEGQTHDVSPEVLAPVLEEFFAR